MQEVDDIKSLVLPMVLQKLDNTGVLGQLKAKMRAQVFGVNSITITFLFGNIFNKIKF
jgi:hypothetical protein